jgi:hypothetical protein
MYFRYKHGRPGHCLQGRYGAKLVAGDDYIVRLTRYLHLNPVKTKPIVNLPVAERRAHLESHHWSSYRGYAGLSEREAMVDYRWLSLMGGRTDAGRMRAYRKYVESMIGNDDDVMQEALTASRYAIGDDTFLEEAERTLKEMPLPVETRRDVALPTAHRRTLPEIETAVATEFGLATPDLHRHGLHAGIAKAVAIELCCLFSGKTQREISIHYAYRSDGGVARQRRVLRQSMHESPSLRTRFESLKCALSHPKI